MSEKSREGVSVRDGDKSFEVVREVHQAPAIPPPEQLERYEQILPGAAERMVSMAEKQQAHRLELTNVTANRSHFLAVCGQWLVAFVCLFFAVVAAGGVFYDHPNAIYLGGVSAFCILALSAISRRK